VNLCRPLLLSLLALAPTSALAGKSAPRSTVKPHLDITKNAASMRFRVSPDRMEAGGEAVRRVAATVTSDAGGEDVDLVESDAWLHGAASLLALPATDATLTLTLYDSASASLMSFSGTLSTEGAVTLHANATKEVGDDGTCDASSRTGCSAAATSTTSADTATSDSTATALDIEVLAAEVFAAGSGYDLTLDLAGADTYEIAYAELTVTESDEVTTCSKVDGCTTTGSSTTTTAEVGWEDVGAVWEGDLTLSHEGIIELKATTYDEEGKKIESSKAALGLPWLDDGEGINVLAIDEDPLTTLGLLKAFDSNKDGSIRSSDPAFTLAINSGGWSASTLPVSAEVELTDGDTLTIPVNSYQRATKGGDYHLCHEMELMAGALRSKFTITGGSLEIHDAALLDLSTPTCSAGVCVTLTETDDGAYALAATTYGTDATALADELALTVTILAESGEELTCDTETVEFDDDITAVFANEVTFSEAPAGLDLAGKVSLLGAADKKGKQKTLAKGNFYGAFSRDGDGDLILSGVDEGDAESRGDVVVAGDPLTFELTDTDGDGVVSPPPLAAVSGNSLGTKNSSSAASTKPQLL
jgi:hypothetical protein